MKTITEDTVMDFYLTLINEDKVQFLTDKKQIKKTISKLISTLKQTSDIHDKILIAKDLWIQLFEHSMSFIDSDRQGYDALFRYFSFNLVFNKDL